MPNISELPIKLQKLLENTPHCLLFEGAQKEKFAELFAKALLQTDKKEPPDLFILTPEGKGNHHPIHLIREFIKETTLPPFEAKRKVFLIYEAERMLPTSANALLKTLEEPVSEVVMILLSSNVQSLLPTVVSRCFRVFFEGEEVLEEEELAEKMFQIGCSLMKGELPLSRELPEIKNTERALAHLFSFYRDLHLIQSGGDPSLLFHKGKEKALSSVTALAPPLALIQEKIEELLHASTLHVPLAHGLPLLV